MSALRLGFAVACVVVCGALGGCVIYLSPLCTDQIHNGDETGIDCGGSCKQRCEIGDGCRIDGDCDDSRCVGGVCKPFACNDNDKSEQETDIDCGGPKCRPCSGGRHCNIGTDCAGGTCESSTQTCQALALSFGDEQRFPSGFKAYALFADDLDGDGDRDLAVVNEYGSAISVFLNDYDHAGTLNHLVSPVMPPDDTFPNFQTGLYPTGGAIADMNRDGHLDVVTANYHGNSVSVLLNAGNGMLNLRPFATYPTLDKAETSNLTVGDFNKDGNVDVIAANPQRHSLSLFLGHADGTLDPAIDIPIGTDGASQPFSVAAGDFNKDGNDDIAAPDDVSGTVKVLLGNGDGTFQPEVEYTIGGTRSFIIIARDIDHDGVLDLLTANRSSDNVSVLRGRGDGTFHRAVVTTIHPPDAPKIDFAPYAIEVGDFNRDGVLDVITPNYKSDSVSILLGLGDGRFDPAIEVKFQTPTDPRYMFTTPYGVVPVDFNHDGKLDFATANAGSNDVILKLNTGH